MPVTALVITQAAVTLVNIYIQTTDVANRGQQCTIPPPDVCSSQLTTKYREMRADFWNGILHCFDVTFGINVHNEKIRLIKCYSTWFYEFYLFPLTLNSSYISNY